MYFYLYQRGDYHFQKNINLRKIKMDRYFYLYQRGGLTFSKNITLRKITWKEGPFPQTYYFYLYQRGDYHCQKIKKDKLKRWTRNVLFLSLSKRATRHDSGKGQSGMNQAEETDTTKEKNRMEPKYKKGEKSTKNPKIKIRDKSDTTKEKNRMELKYKKR